MVKFMAAVASATISLTLSAFSASATSIPFTGNNCQNGLPFVYTGTGNGNGNFGSDCSFQKTAFGNDLTPLIYRANVDEAPENYDYDSNDGKYVFTLSGDVFGDFSSIDGSEFEVWQDANKRVGWSYTKGLGDPTVTVVSLKGGPGGTAYQLNPASGDTGRTGLFVGPNGSGAAALSNIAFFDSGSSVPAVPLPAAGWMLLAGFGSLAAMQRRRRA